MSFVKQNTAFASHYKLNIDGGTISGIDISGLTPDGVRFTSVENSSITTDGGYYTLTYNNGLPELGLYTLYYELFTDAGGQTTSTAKDTQHIYVLPNTALIETSITL
jgi:hypothetical protein